MSKEDVSLIPIRSMRQRRSGEPLPPVPEAAPVPEPQAPVAPVAPADPYAHSTTRKRPEPMPSGMHKCSVTLPKGTRMALEEARMKQDLRPLSAIINEACLEYLQRVGIVVKD